MPEELQHEESGAERERQVASPSEEFVSTEATVPGEEEDVAGAADQAKELQEVQDRYLRLAAEFENYRKRVARERGEVIRNAQDAVLLEHLPVVDNLERALAAARSAAVSSRANEALIEGVDMTLRLFRGVLEKEGVKAIESVGKQFDPTVHHAAEQVRTPDYPDNTVVEEILKGYVRDHRVLRPALVKVATGAPAPGTADDTPGGIDGE